MDAAAVKFGRGAGDYVAHRQGFPQSFFDRLSGWGIGRPHQRLLDIGTGTGALARRFAQQGCTVTGVDHDAAMLEAARQLARDEALAIEWQVAPAEATGLPSAAFDIVTAGQCWHWFDRPQAAAEARRLLVPGGWLVIAHFSWLPIEGNVAWWTERLIEQHNPGWQLGGHNGIHAEELTDLDRAGFTDIESFSFDEPTIYTHEAWRGRIRASAGVSATLSPEAVAAFDAAHAALLAERFPGDPLPVPHRIFAALGRTPR